MTASTRDTPEPIPSSEDIRAARIAAGLTLDRASQLLSVGLRSWQRYEYGERTMHPAMWRAWRARVALLAGRRAEALRIIDGG